MMISEFYPLQYLDKKNHEPSLYKTPCFSLKQGVFCYFFDSSTLSIPFDNVEYSKQ